MQAQDVWIRTLYDRHRFVVRGNLGWIEADDFDKVPPDLRFFAGGDRSIRGYKYKSISPKDDDGKLIGASKLATGSLEYQYNVSGKWWGAVFVDSGEAVSDIRKSDFKTGAGVGVRWQSPVGPIKLDIAGRSATKKSTVYSFTSVWGLNYEFMEEDKPRRTDRVGAAAGDGRVPGRHDHRPASGVQGGGPLGTGAGNRQSDRRLA
jgi:translocation and assembly module TamA